LTDWIGEITKGQGNYNKKPPTPETIIATLRTDPKLYSSFADFMVRAVHGKCGYAQKAGSKSMMFGDFVTVSQEAFTLLLYKNGYDNWIWKHNNMATSGDTDATNEAAQMPPYLYTSTGATEGSAFTTRNGGWSSEGMQEFNALYAGVKESRAADQGSFDGLYKEHWRETKMVSKYKRRKVKDNRVVVTSVCDDLEDPDEGRYRQAV
jgi:hypothetical protein